jgi:predicted permease
MNASSGPSLFERLYNLLLKAYPRRFRARFEHEMRESVRSDEVHAREAGLGASTRFYSRTAAEAVVFGLAERRKGTGDGPRPSRWAVDWRDAWRSLGAAPVVTTVAVLSLALGIGANTALFTLLDSVLLKRLPVRAPEELVVTRDRQWTNPIWEQIRDRKVLGNAFAWSGDNFNVAERGEADVVPGLYASGDFFNVLGVRPLVGRVFGPDDDTHAGGTNGPVVVISYGFWQRRFGGDPAVTGRRLRADGVSYTIIGVTPEGFFGPDVGRFADLMVPIGDLALRPESKAKLTERANWWLGFMARLAPGQTIASVQQDLERAKPAIRAATLPDWPAKVLATYLTEPMLLDPAASGESDLRSTYVKPLEIILAVVGAVLIIACANIANLLLARATARHREFSLRLALGASRARIVRQLLAESAMLAAAGGAGGLVIARWGSGLLVHQIGGRNPVALDLSADWRVFAFTAAVAIVTALLFGVAPAVGIGRVAPHEALKEQGRSVIGDRRLGIRNVLVVIQVSLSLALVVAGGLFVRTFQSLATSTIGLDVDPVLVATVNGNRLPVHDDAAVSARFNDLLDAVRATPGVAAATLSEISPLSGSRWNTSVQQPEGSEALPDREHWAWVNPVTPGWFSTYGVPILSGRDFDAHDMQGAAPVVIVDETFARKYLAGKPVVGARITAPGLDVATAQGFTVVGLARDAIYGSVRWGFQPTVYFPLSQHSTAKRLTLGVRAAGGGPAALAPSIARTIARAMPEAGFTTRLLSDQVGATFRQERLLAMLAGFFGALALLLAALGLYGVTAYSVNRRRAEIGIRMALGADRVGVVRMVVGRVATLVAMGVVLGGALSFWASAFVTKLLFEVTPHDPVMFIGAAVVLASAALAASWLPARRAASIDPSKVLREG